MIGLEQILGFIGVKPEAVAQLREMITPEKVEAGLAQLKALEGRLTALENSVFQTEEQTFQAMKILLELRDRTPNQLAPPSNPLMEIPQTVSASLATPVETPFNQVELFDTSTGAQQGNREGETIPPVFQLEMDKQLALMLRANGVQLDDDSSSEPSVGTSVTLGGHSWGGSGGSGGDGIG